MTDTLFTDFTYKMFKNVVFLMLLVVDNLAAGPKPKEDKVISQLIEEARQQVNLYRLTKAREDVQRLNSIRIFIPNASGFGHESAAMQLLDQLVKSENKAVIEIVYDKAVKERLRTIKPGFENSDSKINFTDKESFKPKFDKDGMAFIAGSENGCTEQEMKQLLDLTKVPCGITLQPYAWVAGKRCLACKEGHREDGPVIIEEPNLPESSTYIFEVKVPKSLNEFFKHYIYSNKAVPEAQTKKYNIIEYILNKVLTEKSELMMLHGTNQGYWGKEVLVNIQTGVEQAKLDKPSILLLMGEDTLKPRTLGIIYSTDDIEPVMIDDFVNGKGQGRQITVQAGQVTEPIFNLVCKLSSLPMVFEGSSLANLAYLLEKPFIPVKDASKPFPTVKEATARKMLKELADHIRDDVSWTKRRHQLQEYTKMLLNLRRARRLDVGKNPSEKVNVLRNMVDYVTPSADEDKTLNSFIERLQAKCTTLGVAKDIFPEEFSSFRSTDSKDTLSGKVGKVIGQLKSELISYKAEFQRAFGLPGLTAHMIGSEEIYQPPKIAETDEERWKANQEMEAITKELKEMEVKVLRNSFEEFLEEIKANVIFKAKDKIEVEPYAGASSLVKNVIVQSKIKGSELKRYYEKYFGIPKQLENNQLVQSLYLISTMKTPERDKLVKCFARNIYRINTNLTNFEKDAEKLNISSRIKFIVRSRNQEYESISKGKKDFRERLFMLKELKNTMKETLSSVIDELKTKIKAGLDKTIKNEIIVYDSVFTQLVKRLEESVEKCA